MTSAFAYESWAAYVAYGNGAPSAVHGRADQIGAAPLPLLSRIGRAGTGGIEGAEFYLLRPGYQPFAVIDRTGETTGSHAALMAEVKSGFGRTMSRLPEVFGVSRQTLYNWIGGDRPRPMYEPRIEQLAAAARIFSESAFKPTSAMLDRTLAGGKTFLQLLSEGADGREAAQKLIRVVKRGVQARSKLDALLVGRKKQTLAASDFGTPSFKEDV
ncbi:hypothetical protein [Mitsuaria sp. 7]|uniref:hypothetical protein n=1 Tax=Mitsuaria sp. 7 TaxID=1658665 RepID=UPI0007DD5185|nr:hypothetical protein [Mitsuaria sp. 7]ANH69820.1 hypothetical protein ABE85_23580 [Mitsuaria sp. 7]